MKDIPFVSVVVPFRNNEKDTKECIKSLLNQTYPKNKYEIILVNNNSDDQSKKLIKPYLDKVILANEKKIGRASARNKGISVSKGEIIAFIDSDCVAKKDWLTQLVKPYKSKRVQAVAGEIKPYNPKTQVEEFFGQALSQKKFLSEKIPYAATGNFSFRKILSKRILFDEELPYLVDVDFSWELYEKGYNIFYEPDSIVYHRNPKSKSQLFRRYFLEGFYEPLLIKKHNSFLKKNYQLKRINIYGYLNLIRALLRLFSLGNSRKTKAHLFISLIHSSAKKLGLIAGSIRFCFLYV